MDGSSYGNMFGGPPPMSPDTPASSSDQYKVNVSRQKTRKWAEFKPQNYDGDDWGDDYDDGPEATPPPPPPSSSKPMAPRQPPTPPSGSRQLAPGGPPSLQLQTQRAASTPAGPVSAGAALERTDAGQLASLQSAMPHSAAATVSSMHSGTTPPASAHPGALPPARARSPGVSLSAGPTPTRFPPRKSSLGPQDAPAPAIGSAPRSRSSSRPGSSRGASWSEQRPSSPANSRSPLTSPTKVQAFTRPADIYRRMEEERQKERERRSMESAGRPSLDGSPSPTVPRSQTELPEQKYKPEEGADAGRGLRPSLPPVAERKSEYGLDVLIASYGSEDTEPAVPAQSKPTPVPAQPSPPSLPSQSSPPPAAPAAAVNMRRFSGGPKLPELGRMSGFGADLFSMSSEFSSDLPSRLPPLPDTPAQGRTPVQDPGHVAQADASTRPTQATAEIPQASTPVPNQDGQAGQADVRPSSPRQQDPATEAPRHTVQDQQVTRPPLPGSPSPLMAAAVEGFQPEETPATKQQQSTPSRQGSPLAPPPLRTASPSSKMSPTVPSQIEAKDGDGEDSQATGPLQAAAATYEAEITPTAPLKPSRSLQNIGPSAGPSFVPRPPPAIDSSSALDTTSNSPIKESDVLREEIMKSLSPLTPSNDYLAAAGPTAAASTPSTAAYHVAAGSPLRESAYLGDVYGDYWDSTEDKPAPGLVVTEHKTEPKPSAPAQVDTKPQDDLPQLATPTGEAQVLAPDPGPERKTSELRRRFSWETGAEGSKAPNPPPQAGGSSPTEEKSSDSEAVNTAFVASAEAASKLPASPPSLTVPPAETTATLPNQAPAVGISHQVSGASTIPPGSKMDVPIEPPSPISVQSDRNRPSAEGGRLSTIEDKVLVQTSTRIVSPPPPVDQHPALASESQPSPPPQAEPVSPTKIDAINIISFRQIMEMPSSLERARLFNETRLQFAAMDTGLNEWLSSMVRQHPEHASSSWSFRASVMVPGTATDRQQAGPMASQAGDQAPYTQQANASTVGLARPAANMPMPPTPPHGSSAFGHSGAHVQVAQVGTKSKKLLMAAGKAGKGLLSKGKSKLSGGDKAFFNS